MSDQRTRKILFAGLFVCLVALAGCVVTIETTVTSDGEIGETELTVEFDTQANFSLAQSAAQSEGYDNVAEWLASDFNTTDEGGVWGDIETSVDQDDLVAEVVASDGTAEGLDGVNVTVDEATGQVTYTDSSGFDETNETGGMTGDFEYTYRVNMPGEVIETNGEVQGDGSTVEWSGTASGETDNFTVTSEQFGADNSGDDGDGGGVVDGLGPGFGIAAVVGAILLLVGRAYTHRRG